ERKHPEAAKSRVQLPAQRIRVVIQAERVLVETLQADDLHRPLTVEEFRPRSPREDLDLPAGDAPHRAHVEILREAPIEWSPVEHRRYRRGLVELRPVGIVHRHPSVGDAGPVRLHETQPLGGRLCDAEPFEIAAPGIDAGGAPRAEYFLPLE